MSNSPLLIDTNIIIDFLKGRKETISFFQSLKSKTVLLISTISVTELFAGIKSEDEEEIINIYLEGYSVIPVNFTLAKKSGLIKKEYAPSHGIGIADAVIAATAIDRNAKLITLNLKHFPMVEFKEAPY